MLRRSGPLRRSKPLRPSGMSRKVEIVRQRAIAKVNPKRRAERFERAYLSTAYVAFIHWKGCVVDGCTRQPIHACHRIPRSRGGTWRDLFGGCAHHHEEQHRIGVRAFEQRHGVDLEAECARNVMEWRAFTTEAATAVEGAPDG